MELAVLHTPCQVQGVQVRLWRDGVRVGRDGHGGAERQGHLGPHQGTVAAWCRHAAGTNLSYKQPSFHILNPSSSDA